MAKRLREPADTAENVAITEGPRRCPEWRDAAWRRAQWSHWQWKHMRWCWMALTHSHWLPEELRMLLLRDALCLKYKRTIAVHRSTPRCSDEQAADWIFLEGYDAFVEAWRPPDEAPLRLEYSINSRVEMAADWVFMQRSAGRNINTQEDLMEALTRTGHGGELVFHFWVSPRVA